MLISCHFTGEKILLDSIFLALQQSDFFLSEELQNHWNIGWILSKLHLILLEITSLNGLKLNKCI